MARVRQFSKDMGMSYNQANNLVKKGRALKDGGSSILEGTMNQAKMVKAKNGKMNSLKPIPADAKGLQALKKERPDVLIGILGCMAQHVKDDILHNKSYVDFVLGPDSYRRLPDLLKRQEYTRDSIVDTRLSRFEVYEDLFPSRKEGINAWVSIMRGCDKFCTFCIVPFTRGRERSRNLTSIIKEVKQAVNLGFLEITLLGQNVNSYQSNKIRFPELLDSVSQIKGVKRIRFTSPHPKDIDDQMLFIMRDKSNICNSVHLPLQAGSDRILKRMNRTYTKSEFISLAKRIRNVLPDCSLSTDIIAGFPGETDKDFEETLDVMEQI